CPSRRGVGMWGHWPVVGCAWVGRVSPVPLTHPAPASPSRAEGVSGTPEPSRTGSGSPTSPPRLDSPRCAADVVEVDHDLGDGLADVAAADLLERLRASEQSGWSASRLGEP